MGFFSFFLVFPYFTYVYFFLSLIVYFVCNFLNGMIYFFIKKIMNMKKCSQFKHYTCKIMTFFVIQNIYNVLICKSTFQFKIVLQRTALKIHIFLITTHNHILYAFFLSRKIVDKKETFGP